MAKSPKRRSMANQTGGGRKTPAPSLSKMKALITLTFLLIFGWVIGVTFFGSEIARAINAPLPTKQVKRTR